MEAVTGRPQPDLGVTGWGAASTGYPRRAWKAGLLFPPQQLPAQRVSAEQGLELDAEGAPGAMQEDPVSSSRKCRQPLPELKPAGWAAGGPGRRNSAQ